MTTDTIHHLPTCGYLIRLLHAVDQNRDTPLTPANLRSLGKGFILAADEMEKK